jgi:peptide/nickel transport system substrate-binding protein
MSFGFRPALILSLAAAALLVTGVACGETAEPTSAAPAAAATEAPVAPAAAAPAAAQPAADPTPTHTPPPEATIRPTNTPVAEYEARIAPTPTPSGPPRQGGTVRMSAYADSKDWDPLGSASLSSVISYSQLYNQLVHYNSVETDQVEGDLAMDWQVSADGMTYTFNMQPDAVWNDGAPITAADAVYSMLRYANPCNPAGRSGLWRQYTIPLEVTELADKADCTPINADEVVRQVDDTTLEFSLRFPSGAFIKFMAVDYVKILPKHLLEQDIDLNLSENIIKHNSGSGPFILEEYQSGNFYNVNKNPNYFKDGLPYVDRIEHYIITTPATAQAQVEARQIDMSNAATLNLTAPEYYALEQRTNSEYVAHDIFGGATRGFMLNIKREPLSDHRVRQAINLAVDRQKHNERGLHNAGRGHCPLVGMANTLEECVTWPGMRPKDSPGGQEDIARARELMAQAGYPDGFEVQYTARQVGTYVDECSVIKQSLEDFLGITGSIEVLPSAAGYAKYGTSRPADAKGDWEVSCQADGMTVLDPDAIYGGIFLKGGTRNYTDWEAPEVNAWFEEQKVELDPDRRREINKEAERWLHDFSNNHWVTLTLGQAFWVVNRDVKGFVAPQTVQYGFKHEHLWLDR